MEKVLVTGATGFLGKYLTEQLLADGYEVLALGRNKAAGEVLERMGAIFCPGDFTDKEACATYFKDVEYVVHAGALSTVWGTWEAFYNTNVAGTKTVCELCLEYGVKRMVYISSPSIYSGKEHRFDIKESEYDKGNELNFYIKSKILSEEVIREFDKKGLDTVTLRPRGLIGIGDTSLIPRILNANGKIGIPLFHGGENYVDITCVENVAYAVALALKAPGVKGDVFNITNGEPMRFKVILEQFLAAIDEEPKYLKLPFGLAYGIASLIETIYRVFRKKGEPMLTRYTVCTLAFSQTLDITKAKEKLGYAPKITLGEGIKNYGTWWKEHHGSKAV